MLHVFFGIILDVLKEFFIFLEKFELIFFPPLLVFNSHTSQSNHLSEYITNIFICNLKCSNIL